MTLTAAGAPTSATLLDAPLRSADRDAEGADCGLAPGGRGTPGFDSSAILAGYQMRKCGD